MAMLGRIVSFNVGVEVGQIAALVIMLLIMNELRKLRLFERLSKVFNDGIMLAGFMLLLMQLHGYLHTSNPDEYSFSTDNHIHHHMEMEKTQTEDNSQHDNL